jgi:hypothetical protein
LCPHPVRRRWWNRPRVNRVPLFVHQGMWKTLLKRAKVKKLRFQIEERSLSRLLNPWLVNQGCQIFLGTTYQNGKNIPNNHKIYLMDTKFTQWS